MLSLRYPTVVILAPPFLSHFNPLMGIAGALAAIGTEIIVGCTDTFRKDVEKAGFRFVEVEINRNSNRGVAVETRQAEDEERRLQEFLNATCQGPVETLITQARHRSSDMFANPEELIDRIRQLDGEINPSLWIIDQLSYGATLALYGLGLPFITFCAPHPASIPLPDEIYGVPPSWPRGLEPTEPALERLRDTAREVEKSFTREFNRILNETFGREPVESAFRLHSPTAVIFNYPPFPSVRASTGSAESIAGGHTVRTQELTGEWATIPEETSGLAVIAFGTFLGSRGDVIKKAIEALRGVLPESIIAVGAGGSFGELPDKFDDRVIIRRFIPQRALLERADLVIHHGGVSSFTESLYFGTPMIVMPFSSDQFSVAGDVERLNLGAVLDPNGFDADLVASAVRLAQNSETGSVLEHWSDIVRSRGPKYVAEQIQNTGGNR